MTLQAYLGVFVGLLGASFPLRAGETPNAASREVSITIRTDHPQREVPRHFLGLAVEKEQLNSGEFVRENVQLTHLLKNLGAGTIRFGGSSTDYTAFVPVESQLPSSCLIKKKRAIAPAAIEEMFRFVERANWQVIYSLNLGCFAPNAAAQEAAYVNSVSRGRLLAFEVGNEPDMLHLQGFRKAPYGAAAFLEQYHAYRLALQSAIPEVRLSGPGTGSFVNGVTWLPRFLTAAPDRLAFASVHFYPMVRADDLPRGIPAIPESSPVFPTIAHLLNSKFPQLAMSHIFAPQMQAAAAHRLPFRITEMNSVARGGKSGVSDTFASALWILDYSFRFLNLGADGINVTTDLPSGSVYSAIQMKDGVHVARPIYYGMLFFHQAAQGRVVPTEIETGTPELNFSAYSTLGPDRTLRVTLINKEAALTVRARIQIAGEGYRAARMIRLSAPSLDAQSGVELGGEAVKSDGSWHPKRWEAIKEESGTLFVSLPPGSATLVIAGPRKHK